MFLPALLVLGALGAVGWLLSHQTSAASRQLRQDMQTAHALAVAREALIGFAATYRSKEHPDADFGYLPCPDLDGDGSSETCGTKDQTSVGRLPYLTLNLPDLRDGAGECLWYAVAGSVKNNPKPDVLNWDSTGRFRLHDTSGTAIALPGDQAGLAAALVIAAGPPAPASTAAPAPPAAAATRRPATSSTTSKPSAPPPAAASSTSARAPRPATTASPRSPPATSIASSSAARATAPTSRACSRPPPPASPKPAPRRGRPRSPRPRRARPPAAPRPPERPLPQRRAARRRRQLGRDDALRPLPDGTDCLAGSGGRCRGALIFGGERSGSQPRITPADRQSTANYLEAPTLAALAAGHLGGLPERIALPFASSDPAVSTDVALCIP
jgi:hypothetical protein